MKTSAMLKNSHCEIIQLFDKTTVQSASHLVGRFSVAPMLDWTNRHCRFFLRQLSRRTLLYTEMVTTGALLLSKIDYLDYNDLEHPLVL